MPSKSSAQHRFMEAIANDPKFARKVGVPQSVGKEFVQADSGRKITTMSPVKHRIAKMYNGA